MRVVIYDIDESPVGSASVAAAVSYGKLDANARRAETCFRLRHMSVFEFAGFTAHVSGISRALED